MPPFLNVERSLTGRRWRGRLNEERLALAISQRFSLHDCLGRVLAARGVGLDEVEGFLEPRLRDLLPDPAHLLDMEAAVSRMVAAINGGESIGVFADYDVDGASSAALLARFLSALGRDAVVYVPDRIQEGYGPNVPALMKMKNAGVSLVFTVDCGTTALATLDEVSRAGLDVIVLDHHVPEARLPHVTAVINPNRKDETSPVRQLCAAGVTFLFIVAVNRELRNAYWYGEGHAEPDLMGLLDLVALATIADVVPLTGVNRAFVRQGLAVMARRQNLGLAALADVSRLDGIPESGHVGYQLAPRVNAGGRVGEPGLGARLLATADAQNARALAERLDGYNRERQSIEQRVLEDALRQAEGQAEDNIPFLLVANEGWHPGVVGIVASRLKDKYHRPACAVALADGIGMGSGRSVRGISLGPAVIAAHEAGLLIKGGGHAMAAGFTVEQARLGELKTFLADNIAGQLGGPLGPPELGIDAALRPEGASLELIADLERAGPFGSGNARPRFAFPSVVPVFAKIVGRDHVQCQLQASEGGQRLSSVAFRSVGTPVGKMLLKSRGTAMHVAGHLGIDKWQGTARPRLIIGDIASPIE